MAVQDKQARKREEIVAAAFRVIAKKGLAGATVREVAREAGFSPGALVHYMKAKDELLAEVSTYSASLVRKRMEALEKRYAGIELLRRLAWECMPLGEERRGHWRIWLGYCERAAENPHFFKVIRDRHKEMARRVCRALNDAIKAKEISASINLAETAESLSAMIDGIGMRSTINKQPTSAARQRRLLDGWIEGMLQPKTSKRA